jgi:hypothetical chaperone protein
MGSALGLDFGTTNTVLARAGSNAQAQPIVFSFDGAGIATIRSILCFWFDNAAGVQSASGPWAIRHFLDHAGDCRLLQSLKTFAANPHFSRTFIYGKSYQFEDLLAVFLRNVLDQAQSALATGPQRLVVGRPVRFAGTSPDESLATQRYRDALKRVGFDDIHFVYEPVAAAFHYAQRLKHDATIVIADFGGGTTDYSVLRFRLDGGTVRAEPLSHAGLGIAGDSFDYRIIDHVVSPRLGKDTQYRSMTKVLDIPKHYYANFARWNLLSVMKTTKEFRDLKGLVKASLRPELLEQFVELIENEQGYALYSAVSKAKEALSRDSETMFEFSAPGTKIRAKITRANFESWIEDDLRRIDDSLAEALRAASVTATQVDKVFLTGGTSFVPAVRRQFADRFGADKIEAGDELVSIANGLALIGERDDIEQWAVPGR